MSDLINRQAILKHIEKIRHGVQMMDDTHRAGIIMNGMYLCEKAVRNQPSAQPEWKKVGENPMISEEKMKIVINNYFKDECNVNMSIREAFEKGFRIGVKKGESLTKVIKCKNCKNFRKNIPCVGGFYDGCTELLNEGNEIPVDENFYCGFAKRKTDGQIN